MGAAFSASPQGDQDRLSRTQQESPFWCQFLPRSWASGDHSHSTLSSLLTDVISDGYQSALSCFKMLRGSLKENHSVLLPTLRSLLKCCTMQKLPNCFSVWKLVYNFERKHVWVSQSDVPWYIFSSPQNIVGIQPKEWRGWILRKPMTSIFYKAVLPRKGWYRILICDLDTN